MSDIIEAGEMEPGMTLYRARRHPQHSDASTIQRATVVRIQDADVVVLRSERGEEWRTSIASLAELGYAATPAGAARLAARAWERVIADAEQTLAYARAVVAETHALLAALAEEAP